MRILLDAVPVWISTLWCLDFVAGLYIQQQQTEKVSVWDYWTYNSIWDEDYFIIFGGPSIKAYFEYFGELIFAHDVTYSPISLIIFSVNEIMLIVDLLYRSGFILLDCWHFSASKQKIWLLKNYN
jgi:hypothetical protein